jgi:DNA-binding LacI/PurR family transcriptional regulator
MYAENGWCTYPLIDGFYFNGMLQGIHYTAVKHNINLVLFQTMDSNYTQVDYNSNLADQYIDGWIVIYYGENDSEYMKQSVLIWQHFLWYRSLMNGV